ncbi:hypothetical protein GCM10020255_079780 [Rhodococcus baikonurensis]
MGSGIRRVEAYVGLDSYRYLAKERALLAGLSSSLKVPSEEVPARVEALVERLKVAEKELEQTKAKAVLASAGEYVAKAKRIGSVLVIAEPAPAGVGGNDLRSLVTDIKGRLGSEPAVVALLGDVDGKVPFVVASSKAAQGLGVKAGELVASFGPKIGGRGGGKPDMAQGSGSTPQESRRRSMRSGTESESWRAAADGGGYAAGSRSPRHRRPWSRAAHRHRRRQRSHRRRVQRPRRHPRDTGGNGSTLEGAWARRAGYPAHYRHRVRIRGR